MAAAAPCDADTVTVATEGACVVLSPAPPSSVVALVLGPKVWPSQVCVPPEVDDVNEATSPLGDSILPVVSLDADVVSLSVMDRLPVVVAEALLYGAVPGTDPVYVAFHAEYTDTTLLGKGAIETE
jgi:hypothetical protein